jgi:hypothetical protein
MKEMELDVKPPPQVASTDDQLRLAELQRAFACLEAPVVETCAFYGEIIAAIDAVAAQVRELRRLRAEGLGAELAAPACKVEWAFANLSVVVSRVAAMRGTAVEMGRICIARDGGGGSSEAADALADALRRIHICLSQ